MSSEVLRACLSAKMAPEFFVYDPDNSANVIETNQSKIIEYFGSRKTNHLKQV